MANEKAPAAPPAARRFYRLTRAALEWDVDPVTLRRAAEAGELRGVQRGKGGHWRFLARDLDGWIAGKPPRTVAAVEEELAS